jgi:hypothetical protein
MTHFFAVRFFNLQVINIGVSQTNQVLTIKTKKNILIINKNIELQQPLHKTFKTYLKCPSLPSI